MFIVIEGIDGSGKTSLVNDLYLWLIREGYDVVRTKEPTNGYFGQRINTHLTNKNSDLTPEQVTKLFFLDRNDHTENFLNPNLAREGRIILCDRYYHSTIAYQGSLGLDWRKIEEDSKNRFIKPDLVIVLQVDPKEAISRIEKSRYSSERFEKKSFLEKVDEIYKYLGGNEIARIDANRNFQDVLADSKKIIRKKLLDYATSIWEEITEDEIFKN